MAVFVVAVSCCPIGCRGDQVARLFLVSDILHNSSASVKNASAYRSEFQVRIVHACSTRLHCRPAITVRHACADAVQECLPDGFESLHRCHSSINGRLTAELMKEKVGCRSIALTTFRIRKSWRRSSFLFASPCIALRHGVTCNDVAGAICAAHVGAGVTVSTAVSHGVGGDVFTEES